MPYPSFDILWINLMISIILAPEVEDNRSYCDYTSAEPVSNGYPTQLQNCGTAHLLLYVISVYL